MKKIAFVLALAISNSQMVGIVDCCCGSFCAHKNACTGCQEGTRCLGRHEANSKGSGLELPCCKTGHHATTPVKKHEEKKGKCSHLEPSQDVTNQPPDVLPPNIPSADPVILDLDSWIKVESSRAGRFLAEVVPESPPQLPRHLLLSVLLI